MAELNRTKEVTEAWCHFARELGFDPNDITSMGLKRQANGETVITLELPLIDGRAQTAIKYLSGFSDHGEWHDNEDRQSQKHP